MTPAIPPLLPAAVGGLLALGCLVMAFRALRRKRLIDDNPTSRTQGVFIGFTEMKGTAETETPLTSHLAAVPCVHYAWQVEEHWSRTVTETYTDSKGHAQTRTRTESGWSTVASGGQSVPFYLKDDTGVILIQPQGASIEAATAFDQTCSRNDALYFGKGPAHEVANSDHHRRLRETTIPLHAMLYVAGQARERQDVVAAEIALDKTAPMFVISVRTEKQVSASLGLRVWLWLVLGMAASAGAAAAWQLLQTFRLTAWQPYAATAGGFFMALGLGWVWTVYNSFIHLHQRVQQAWSLVDVQLKRRHDLVPDLVRAVEGYRSHEAETQTFVAGMRGQLTATPPGVAGPDFKGLAPALKITIERYPELRANESFLKLQEALVDTEQRIALARDYFNGVATFYNIRLGIVPDRWVGALAGLRPRSLMGVSDFERAPVTVKLAQG